MRRLRLLWATLFAALALTAAAAAPSVLAGVTAFPVD
jgi:hypothetical protein